MIRTSTGPAPIRPAAAAPAAAPVRVMTYNTAVGASKIKTPQAAFTQLPAYRDALTNRPGAAVMALQEVGHAQIAAARAFEKAGTCTLIVQRVSMRDQYNMIVVPKRYAVEKAESHHYVKAQLGAVGRAVTKLVKSLGRERTKLTDLIQPRGYLKATLTDTLSGKRFTLFDTHMALDGQVRLDQARQLLGDADKAAKAGPVVIAGDLNARNAATDKHPGGADSAFRDRIAGWTDMGAATAAERTLVGSEGNIDWVLARGFAAQSSRIHDDVKLSDHYAEDDLLDFAR